MPSRQTRFLIACALLLIILAFIPQQWVTDHEVFLIFFVALPLGLLTLLPSPIRS